MENQQTSSNSDYSEISSPLSFIYFKNSLTPSPSHSIIPYEAYGQIFYEYYISLEKGNFIQTASHDIIAKLKEILETNFNFNEFEICKKDIIIFIQIILLALQRAIFRWLYESLDRSQNIFQFQKQKWKKFAQSFPFIELKNKAKLKQDQAKENLTKKMHDANIYGMCAKCLPTIKDVVTDLCSIPIKKFYMNYNELIYNVMRLFDHKVQINKELLRPATFLMYSMVISIIHKPQDFNIKFRHYFKFQSLQSEHGKALDESHFDFDIYYKFIKGVDIQTLEKHYSVLYNEYKKL